MVWKNEQVSKGETEKILEVLRKVLGMSADVFGALGAFGAVGNADSVANRAVAGDVVEMGCYKGDTSLLLAEVLREYNRGGGCGKPVENFAEKKLWIYDSFEGLPEKTKADKSVLGEDFRQGELSTTKRAVKERFLRAGLPVPVIKKAWFADLAEADLPERISLAFLDGDLYESIRDCLKLVVPKMAQGGVILVHDYQNPALPGVKKAVEEVFSEVGVVESLAVIWV